MEEGRDRRNRNPQEGWGWGPEAAGIFSFVYPALILSPWEVFPWLELFLLSDPGNPGGLEAWEGHYRGSYRESLSLVTLSQALMVNLGSDRFIRQVRVGCCRAWPDPGWVLV